MKKNNIDVKKMVGMAVFAVFAFVATLVFRIPVSFLTFDAKDAVLTIASFIYGPISAVAMSLVVAVLELTISQTGLIGALMNFASSAAFAGIASLIYSKKRTFNGALVGLYSAVAATTALMVIMNIFITPIYLGVDRSIVISMLPALLLPFNLAKTLMNGAITMFLYKPVAMALRRAKLIERKALDTKFGKQSIITIAVGTLSLIAAIVIFVIINSK